MSKTNLPPPLHFASRLGRVLILGTVLWVLGIGAVAAADMKRGSGGSGVGPGHGDFDAVMKALITELKAVAPAYEEFRQAGEVLRDITYKWKNPNRDLVEMPELLHQTMEKDLPIASLDAKAVTVEGRPVWDSLTDEEKGQHPEWRHKIFSWVVTVEVLGREKKILFIATSDKTRHPSTSSIASMQYAFGDQARAERVAKLFRQAIGLATSQ